jgi:Predicted acetyltransferase
MIDIRSIVPNDYSEVRQMVQQSFMAAEHSDGNEQDLISELRKESSYDNDLEVIAEDEATDTIVGHGLLSKILIVGAGKVTEELCLAPLSVAIKYQRQGIGISIIHTLEKRALAKGYGAISILGDPAYYGRFGYVPAERYSIDAPFEVNPAFFMIRELKTGALHGVEGTIHYPQPFGI